MRGQADGVTLIEVLLSLVLLQVGLLGVGGMITLAARTLNAARDVEWAVQEARAVADSIAFFGAAGSGEAWSPFGTVRWNVVIGEPLSETRIVVDGESRRLVDVSLLALNRPVGAP